MAKKENAFERVMRLVEAYHRQQFQRSNGAKTWIAAELGVTKQALVTFQKQGRFPKGYIHRIAALLGTNVEVLMGDFSGDVEALAKKWKLSYRDAELILIRAGLDVLTDQ